MENDACSYRRFLDGDESAFDEIQEAFFNRLVFFINRYLQDYAASEDVAIDVLAELAVKKKYNFKSSLSTYLFTMAKSRALTQLKKRKRRGEALPLDETELADETELEEALLKSERLRALSAALAGLPEKMRTALHLVYFEDMSYEEVARVMHCTKKQVDNTLSRAKVKLRSLIDKED